MPTAPAETAEPRDANVPSEPEARKAFFQTIGTLQAIFRASPVAMAALDLDGKVRLWSRAAARLFGWQESEILGQPLLIVPEEFREQFERLWATVLSGAGISNLEVRRRTRKGKPVDLVLSMAPLVDESGKVTGVLSVYADVTRRRRTDRELARVNRALRTLTACDEALTQETEEPTLLREICQIIVDAGYRLSWVGYAEEDAAKTVTPVAFAGLEEGYTERLGITWADTDRGRGPTGTSIREGRTVIERDIPHDPEFAPWREDALKRGYAASIALPLRDSEKVFGALMIYAGDPKAFVEEEVALLTRLAENLSHGITALRQRRAREEAETRGRGSEQRYRTLFETATESILLIDPRGTVLDANPAVAAFLGRPIAEVVGKNVWQVARTENPELLQGLLKALLEGKPVPDPIYFSMQDSSGRRREVVIRARLISLLDASPTVAIIGRDITEERDAERLALENERLAALGRAAAFIGHELVTPLTNISLLATSLERQSADPKVKEKVTKINEQRLLAARIISDLLSISRPLELRLMETDLRDVVRRGVDEVEVHRKPNVALVASLGDGPIPALVDATRMMQVVDNLLKNALEATSAGRVEVRLEEQPDVVRIIVADTGTGMTPDVVRRIWEPFFTTKAKPEGTGLGLPLCKSIVSAHHGTIEVATEAGKGSVFTVTVPKKPRTASAAAPSSKA